MDAVMIRLMDNFLRNHFPVTKVRRGKGFKRGVNYDGVFYLLPSNSVAFRSAIYHELRTCYATSDAEIRTVIRDFYKIT